MNLAPAPETLDLLNERPNAEAMPNVQDYLRVVFRYLWGVVGLGVLGGLIAAYQAYTDTPIFRASAEILIERDPARYVSIQDVYREQSYDNGDYFQTQYELLKSRPIAERVVAKLGLDEFDRPPPQVRGFNWRRLIGRETASVPSANKAPVAQRTEAAVNLVQGSIQVLPVRNSQLARLTIDGPDPELITKLANAAGQAYIEEMLEGRLQMAQEASTWLNERISGLRQKLQDSEKALQEFRDRERMIDIKGVDSLTAEQITQNSSRLTEAKRERIDKETIYRQVQQVKAKGGRIDQIASIASNPLIAELRRADSQAESAVSELSQRYGPLHPKMIEAKTTRDAARAALERQLDLIEASVAKDYEISQAREGQVAGELGAAKGEMQDLNRKQYQLAALQRDVESNKQLFEMFQTRFKETSASSGMETANARIVELARVPTSPIYPDKRKAILVGLFLGLTLGISLAFLLDHMDNTLKGGEDVERRLGVPVLGMLPKLKTTGRKDFGPLSYFKEQPKSSFSEAVRTIRTGVLLSAIDHPHRRVLVTSSVPGEGKTTLASNLAYALGQMRKVLLIDADMRRPSVHRGLPEASDAKGLSHFVSGEANISDCMTHIEGTNLYVMRAGAVPPNPLELLSSKRFEDALEGLSKAFDHVIIDCAPACAVSDALVLSRMVHAVVYVIRSDSTPWQLADQGLKRLRRVNAPLVGAVVNQVLPRKGRYGYGYSYAYGKYYYYGDGYYHDYGYNAGKKS